jgi:hypothetical protein
MSDLEDGGGGSTGTNNSALDFYTLFVIDRALKNGQLPAELVDEVFKTYEDDLQDPASNASKFFRVLNTARTPDELKLFYDAFLLLINEDYVVDDFFSFLESNNLTISLAVLGIYIGDIRSAKINKMKEKLFNGFYPEYGNFYNFFFQSVSNEETNSLMIKKVLQSDSLDIKLKPRISYDTIGDFYSSYREAEESYWSLTKDFYASKGYTLNPGSIFGMNLAGFETEYSKNILKFLFNRFSNNLVYGIPILLSKESVKTGYSFLTDQEENIGEILTNSFKGLTRDEFYEILNELVVELVEYYDLVGNVIDYDDNLDLPDLLTFSVAKLSNFGSLDASNYNVRLLKRLKFYKHFVAKFLKITDANAFSREILVEEEFVRLRNTITELREYLLARGKFK